MKRTSLHTRVTGIVIQLLLIHTCVLHAHRKFQRLLPLRCAVHFLVSILLCVEQKQYAYQDNMKAEACDHEIETYMKREVHRNDVM
jgi:hypothetical protein